MKNIGTFIIVSLGILLCSGAMAQSHEVTKLPLQQVQRAGEVNMSQIEEDWAPMLRNTSVIHAPLAEGSEDIEAIKNRLTEELMRNRGNAQNTGTQTRSAIPDPVRLTGFPGDRDTGTPNDDEIATSSTYIVHTSNSSVTVFDANGSVLKALSLAAFGTSVDTLRSPFDPRISYDPVSDRWVLLYDTGSDPGANDLIVAFSQTNDPRQGWNLYNLNGNLRPGGVDVWSDYPQIAITSGELFITANLFNSAGRSPASGVWQVGMADGYAGNNITVQTYLVNDFSLLPVEGTGLTLPGPNMYFLSKAGRTASRDIEMYEIGNTIGAGGTFSHIKTLRGGTYSPAPNAPQKDPPANATNGGALNTGSDRIRHGYRIDDKIYFVISSNISGRPGVYFGEVSLSPLGAAFHGMTTRTFSDPELYIGFPSITYGGVTANGEHSHFIFFNFTSDTKFPGNAIMYMDECGDLSDALILREGEGFLRPTGDATDPRNRWGDYTDISTVFAGEAWVVGYSPNRRHEHISWISQVSAPFGHTCGATAIEHRIPQDIKELKAYPSPAIEKINFDFSVTKDGIYYAYITDLTGRKVHTVLRDRLRPGKARVAFNTLMLAEGTYNIVIEGVDGSIFSKKFIVKK